MTSPRETNRYSNCHGLAAVMENRLESYQLVKLEIALIDLRHGTGRFFLTVTLVVERALHNAAVDMVPCRSVLKMTKSANQRLHLFI